VCGEENFDVVENTFLLRCEHEAVFVVLLLGLFSLFDVLLLLATEVGYVSHLAREDVFFLPLGELGDDGGETGKVDFAGVLEVAVQTWQDLLVDVEELLQPVGVDVE
jgi:hypothetical protein